MDLLLFGLFFAALLIGYVLVHIRLSRLESRLEDLRVLRSIDERLARIAEGNERLRLGPIESRLESLQAAVTDLNGLARRVAARADRPVLAAEPGPVLIDYAEEVRRAVQERLAAQGYERPRFVTDLEQLPAGEPAEIVVECERRGMPYKGKLIVDRGSVSDMHVQSAATTFP